MKGDWDGWVDIATSCTVRDSNPVWEGDFLITTIVQNGTVARPESFTMNTEPLSWGQSGWGVASISLPSKVEVQSGYSYNFTPPLCLPGLLEDDLYLYSLYSFSQHPVT